MMGTAILLLVMKIQSSMYELGLDDILSECEAGIMTVWARKSGAVES